MRMKKYIILLLIVTLICCTGCDMFKKNRFKSYEEAKDQTIKYFMENKSEYEEAVKAVILQKGSVDININGESLLYYKTNNIGEIVKTHMDAQGAFMGSQYWGVYYSSQNQPYLDQDGSTQEAYPLIKAMEDGCYYWEEPNGGNNLYVTERIEENWFFSYMDYNRNTPPPEWHDENGKKLTWEIILPSVTSEVTSDSSGFAN